MISTLEEQTCRVTQPLLVPEAGFSPARTETLKVYVLFAGVVGLGCPDPQRLHHAYMSDMAV
jgi:hypothetical protein